MIPRRSNESRQGTRFDRQAARERNCIERTINRFKQFRRITTRYEKPGIELSGDAHPCCNSSVALGFRTRPKQPGDGFIAVVIVVGRGAAGVEPLAGGKASTPSLIPMS
ncbi:hypothetical protein [Leptothermofonsia sp. ETS-13]|uniref:hypothetical protein n=1 Tax=Leptothermofonsia sp. ETS-13 TaxID=3035696 RepID=UPI003BA2B49C